MKIIKDEKKYAKWTKSIFSAQNDQNLKIREFLVLSVFIVIDIFFFLWIF